MVLLDHAINLIMLIYVHADAIIKARETDKASRWLAVEEAKEIDEAIQRFAVEAARENTGVVVVIPHRVLLGEDVLDTASGLHPWQL